MHMPEMARSWTREMVLELPDDGNRYELFGGELLVSPAPRPVHQFVLAELYQLLGPYVAREAIGRVLFSPADVPLDGNQLAQPDIFVVPVTGPAPRSWTDLPAPFLVIEIVSPSTARYDRQIKRRWFQRYRIHEFWIVDSDARQVERWRPDDSRPEIIDGILEWQPPGASDPLLVALPAVFHRALGET